MNKTFILGIILALIFCGCLGAEPPTIEDSDYWLVGDKTSQAGILGTALILNDKIWQAGRLVLVDLESGRETVLVDDDGVFGPTFSPDGTRVAYTLDGRIYSIGLDGTDNQEITHCAPATASSSGTLKSPQQPSLTWGVDDKIYWTEFTNFVWQVDTVTKVRTKVYTSSTQNWRGQVSLNGERAVVWKSRPEFDDSYAYTIDIKNGTEKRVRSGCNVAITPDGSHIFHMIDPHTEGGHYRQFDHTYLSTLAPPSGASNAGNYRFSTFSSDLLCVTSDPDGSLNTPYVLDVRNDKYFRVGTPSTTGTIWDFLPTEMNQAPSDLSIESPLDGTEFEAGSLVHLNGTGSDPEDGPLSGGSLTWSIDGVSDGLGPLHTATGDSTTFSLPAELNKRQEYLVLFTGTDSGGRTLSTSIYFWGVPVGESNNEPADQTPAIVIESPSGENLVWLVGGMQYISWYAVKIPEVIVEVSIDGGEAWTTIADAVAEGAPAWGNLPWIVPNTPSLACYVRIRGGDPELESISDYPLEIRQDSLEPITINRPLAGDIWPAGSEQMIQWSTATFSDVGIMFSADGGETWAIITSSVDTDSVDWSSYPWTVPDIASDNCIIRIADYGMTYEIDSDRFAIGDASSPATESNPTKIIGNMQSCATSSSGLPCGWLVVGLLFLLGRKSHV